MTINQNGVKPLKMKIVTNKPSLNDCEEGDLFYDVTLGRIYMRTSEGWKYWAESG